MKNKYLLSIRKNLSTIITAVYTIALFLICFPAITFFKIKPLYMIISFISLYLTGLILINIIGKRASSKSGAVKDRLVLSRIIFDGIDKMNSLAFMCRADGRIFWCNEGVRAIMSDGRKPYGKTVQELFGATLEEIRDAPPEDGCGINFEGRHYIANYNSVKFERGSALIIAAESSELKTMGDELDLIHEKIEECEPIVAYIMVDNLTEMIQYDNESYRPAAAKIDELLREWASDAHGIMKEYDRNRYLFVFEKRFLYDFIEKKFEILDKVREVRVGEEQLSVTISVGIASVYGNFADKEKAARAALDMALGRGGDQIVLKGDDSTDFYGGRTKASRRRSSVRSRVVSNEIIMHISRASNVLIMGHKFADYDCFGACVGLARLAMFCGVGVKIIIDKDDSNLTLCKNMLDQVHDYKNIFISSDEAFDLIQTSTFLILADVNNIKITEDPEIIASIERYAVIDHHRKHAEYKHEPELEYIEPKASSTCELVAEMLEQILPQDMLTSQEANLLLAGILLDTKQFSRMTGTRTYGSALYLHDCGAEPQSVQELFKTDLDDYQIETQFRSNVVVYRKCMAITLCENGESSASNDKIIASKAADSLINIKGIKAAFAIITVNNTMHISARSTGEINVQLILEKLRGGGHFDTAGAQLENTAPEDAVRMLKKAIDDYFDDMKTNKDQNVL